MEEELKALLILLFFMALLSCANVQQIDRGFLAKDIMKFDPHPEETVFREEVRTFREGAVGGSAAVGGGCGCN